MQFNTHSDLVGSHAFLSASSYHWIRYDDEKLDEWFGTKLQASKGSRLHAFASEAIELGIKLPRSKKTLNSYVNDCIGFRMKPEQLLFYSYNCFGTADAIRFDEKTRTLLIFDLKTGVTKASVNQLEVYAAMFILEYGEKLGFRPGDLTIELRIYQNDDVQIYEPDLRDIVEIMGKIVRFDARIEQMKERARE